MCIRDSKRGALQKQISETESILKDTKKDVGSQLNSLAAVSYTHLDVYKRQPMDPLKSETSEEELKALFCKNTFKEDYKILNLSLIHI